MIEPRIYRAAFVPALLAVVLGMFSLQVSPAPAPQGLAADVLFEGRLAAVAGRELASRYPNRQAGTVGARRSADLVASRLGRHGFDTELDRFRAEDEDLVNAIGRRTGASPRQVVVMAARDSATRSEADAADTGALIELGRVLQGRATEKTLVLASVDGSSLGDAGARRFAEKHARREPIDAVLVLSNLAARSSQRPQFVAWSGDASRGSIALRRTVAAALREGVGGTMPEEGLAAQLARLALPLGIGAQGVLLERGIEAIRLSGSGELPPSVAERAANREPQRADIERLGDLGRAALRTISALDSPAALEHGPPSYLTVGGSVLPGWAVSLLVGSLILPALIASVDAFARARRRGETVARWSWWAMAGTAPFAMALGAAELAAWAGLAPDAPPAPTTPGAHPLDGEGSAALALTAAAALLGLVFVRPALIRRGGLRARPSAPGAACATAMLLSASTAIVWALNPFAALLLVPAAHAWMLAMLAAGSRRAALVLTAVGLVLPAGAALFYLDRLSLDPLEGAWYFFLTLTGHNLAVTTLVLSCVLLGAFVATIAVVASARHEPVEREPERLPAVRIRGPGNYAGPGSLGGTESALRR